jgi:CxxC motif-containing protein (DUF1111 family)
MKRINNSGYFGLVLSAGLLFAGCEKMTEQVTPYDDPERMVAPIDGLSSDELARFHAGDAIFNGRFFTDETGLGPHFIATSCGSCHNENGKGHPSNQITRFGQSDTLGNLYLDQGGPQLQNRALPGHKPEVIPDGLPIFRSVAPINAGLGFIAGVSDASILANADPNDLNGDGISGVPNRITPKSFFVPQPYHIVLAGKYIGRFGKKGSNVSLLEQVASAFLQDIGVTSPFLPIEPGIIGYTVQSADISLNDVLNTEFFLRTLRQPIQRDQDDPDVIAGEEVFNTIGCVKCHVSEFTTGQLDIDALSYKTFRPFSDLLLHDMGPGLDDNYTEGTALTSEWKTPPLWGLGLAKKAQGGTYFLLHDGRAHSIEEAILFHGGEAHSVKENYLGLSSEDKAKLMRFLESL